MLPNKPLLLGIRVLDGPIMRDADAAPKRGPSGTRSLALKCAVVPMISSDFAAPHCKVEVVGHEISVFLDHCSVDCEEDVGHCIVGNVRTS